MNRDSIQPRARLLLSRASAIKGGLLLVTTALLSSCLGSAPKPPPPPPDNCLEAFEKVLLPVKMQNKHEMHFAIDDFDFLWDSNYKVESIQLEGVMIPRRARMCEFDFSFNGVKAWRKDRDEDDQFEMNCGSRNSKSDKNDGRSDITSPKNFCAQVHKFSLNGGLSFYSMMLQLKKNKGVLRVSLKARDSEIDEARLVVKGKKLKDKCEDPGDPPPPPAEKPKTSIQSVNPASSPTASTNMEFSFSADQAGVGYFCSLDGGAATSCTSPKVYSGLLSGEHTFRVYAVNSAGLSDEVAASHSWVVDAQAPSVQIDNLASLPSLTNLASATLLFSSNEAASFLCSVDEGASFSCQSPHTFAGFNDGSHQIKISAVDSVGNISAHPAVYQWVVDQSAPVSMILSAEPNSAINSADKIKLFFGASESSVYECSLDGGAFASCSSPFEVEVASDGPHWFDVRAIDLAGNLGLPASYSWRTDRVAPVLSLIRSVPAVGATGAHDINVEFEVSETASISCSFDGGDFAPCASPWSRTVDAAGAHQLVVRAVDAAGNQATDLVLNWEMDFSAPEINFGSFTPSAASYINVDDFSVEILSSEPVVLSYKLNGVDMGSFISPLALSALPEGSYSLEISGLDAVGNASNILQHSLTVDMTKPVVNLVAAISGVTNSDSNSFALSANEPVTYEYNADGQGFVPATENFVLSGLAEGDHELIVRGRDLAGNLSDEVSAVWSIDQTAPISGLSMVMTAINAAEFSLNSSETGSSFLCSIDGATPIACTSPYSITGLSAGSHSFTVWAVDAVGNRDTLGATLSFVVLSPITTSITNISPSSSYTNQKSKSFSFAASHTVATFRCSLDGAAATVCSSPMSYAGLTDGAHSFKVQAVDAYGGIDPVGVTHNWTVDTVMPVMTTVSTTVTSTTITINWTTSEPSTTKLLWGKDFALDKVVAEDSVYKTSHSVRLTGLSSNSVYTMKPAGTDRAGNAFTASTVTARTSR